MKSIASRCALMILCFGSTALAESFEYRLPQYPASADDCHQVARDLGKRLTQLSGVPLARAYCADIGQDGYDLRFQYAAQQELARITTIDRANGPDAQGGFYATRAACEAALPAERGRFETATGLTAFVAYCQTDAFAERPYAIRIEGFGAPAVRPRVATADTQGEALGVSAAQLEMRINERLGQRGLNFSYAKYRSFGIFGATSILYYAAERLPLVAAYPVRLRTQGECFATLADLLPAYETQARAPLAVFCAYRDGYRAYDLVTLSLGQEALFPQASAERFASRAACESARPGLTSRYREQEGRTIEASACSYEYDSTEWRVVMLGSAR